jgi:hypothetical protein
MALAGVDQSFAKVLTKIGGADFAKDMGFAPPPFYAEEHPRTDRLPTMVLALEHPIHFDWSPLHELDRFDPGGDWQVEGRPDGSGSLRGRGCTVEITAHSEPVPRYSIDNALARSFWFKGGPGAFARQTASLTIVCDLDTRAAPFEDVRETAKIMTLAIGLLARSRGVIALLNAAVGTLLDVPMVQSQVGHLHKNQIPLMMWTWTAPDSMVENSVSLTTGGLLPFLGYEVEVWNAPGTPDWVGDKLAQILNYLLHVGPIVNDGDPFSEKPGERSIRGFFGTTRAQRADKDMRVLLLEFDGPAGVQPRPDPVPSAQTPAPKVLSGGAPSRDVSAAAPSPGFGRRAAGFGRRGL